MVRYVGFSIPDLYTPVKHRQGSADELPPKGFSSWKDFWQKKAGQSFDQCACKGCSGAATDGAHVIKAGGSDRSWYIVPMCHACNSNQKKEPFFVNKALLVSISDE